jgi:hypothetical protein
MQTLGDSPRSSFPASGPPDAPVEVFKTDPGPVQMFQDEIKGISIFMYGLVILFVARHNSPPEKLGLGRFWPSKTAVTAYINSVGSLQRLGMR